MLGGLKVAWNRHEAEMDLGSKQELTGTIIFSLDYHIHFPHHSST